ncbi:uncharacterized protein mah [Euwallacea fornicatus]|uniref:uncharacterized protein mah n=1 Tax=Euwallacea fornicatus TaxID=995702 RepID=UPI00338E3533
MQTNESTPLLPRHEVRKGLSVVFSIICVVDVFGVFPVVALPKPILDCGYYGIAIISLVCVTQIYTAGLLGKCWNLAEEMDSSITKKNRYPYSALAEITFGKSYSWFVNFLVDITVFGAGIPNLIVAAQNLQLLGLRISDSTFDISFCYWIMVLGVLLCPVLWLGSPKDMKLLCTISVFIVTSVYILTCACLLFTTSTETIEKPKGNFESNLQLWKLVMGAYGIVAFQFDIHPIILTIQMDMKDRTKLSSVIFGGFLITLFMFGTTTLITALKYGNSIKPSLLETLPTSTPLHFAAALVAIQLCLTSAVSNSTLYQHMEDCLNISREFNHKRCILRTILTILAIVIAESVPRFDLVMSLIGGTLTGPLVFILPPIFYMRISYMHRSFSQKLQRQEFSNAILNSHEEEYPRNLVKYYDQRFREELENQRWDWLAWVCNKKIELLLCGAIILFSFVATLVTTYLNLTDAILSYSNFSKPCIYNVSNALLYL